MFSLLFLFMSVLAASALCSMAEAAVLSLPFVRAKVLHDQGKSGSKDLLYIKEHIDKTLATIVILNNTINIIGSIFVGQHAALLFGQKWLGVVSALITFMVIVFGEILPKTIGERYKTTLSLLVAKPLHWLVWFMQPVVDVVMGATKPFIRKRNLPRITEEEIKMMLKMGRDAGTVESDEEILCNHVFRLNDLKAYQMMKPINQIYALQSKSNLSEVKEVVIGSRFSRIAVYDKDLLDVVGIVQHRVLLREIAKDNYEACVQDFMTEPIFISHMTRADTLLEKFRTYHQHLFIVQDEAGKNIGLITMEDVLEELFGEIYDEKDA
jgi:CBS domain containing-hemolysin-like protein